MGLVDLTKDLTYNKEFETNPIENQTGPEVNSNFQTSNLESSPTEEIGSVNFFQNPHGADENGVGGFNISGFTQFMPKLETLYPGEGLNNSGIVDHFPNPHGVGHFFANVEIPHSIGGFIPNFENFVKGTATNGVYPNTIDLFSVDFFPGGNFSNNFVTSTGFTQNADPFGGSKIETEFKMVGEGNTISEGFMNNQLFNSIKIDGTYKGAVNFISDADSYTSGFTKDFSVVHDNVIPADLSTITKYDVSKFYLDKGMSFSVTSGIPNPGLSIYSAGLESQYTTTAETVDGNVSWNLQIPAAGLGDTSPPYGLGQIGFGLQSLNVTTGTGYLGAVNFISDSESYTSGFKKNMTFGTAFMGYYQIGSYYTDPNINQPFPTNGETTGFSVTSGTPNPGLSQYAAGLKSQFTSIANDASSDVTWNLQIPAAGFGDTLPPYTLDQLKLKLPSMQIGTSGYLGAVNFFSDTDSYTSGFTKDFSVVHDNVIPADLSTITNYDITQFYTDNSIVFSIPNPRATTGVTTYPIKGSIFTTDSDIFDDAGENVIGTESQFSVYSKGDFQLGNVAGMGTPGVTPFTYTQLSSDGDTGMMSWNVDGFNITDFTNFGDNVAGKTTNTDYLNYDSFLGIPTGPDGDDVGSIKIHLNKGVFGSGFGSETAYSYENIPSLKSVRRPTFNAVSGPFDVPSGFSNGVFKLGTKPYLQSGAEVDEDGNPTGDAVKGSIVTDVTLGLVRSGVTTLGNKLKDTKFRDIKKMGGMANTVYGTAYGDGINNGWMKGLIDTSIKDEREYSGHSADFFIRESGGGRFLGRIGKDLQRITKWQFSENGLLSLAKNGIMTFFNPSEKSLQLGVLAQYTAAAGNMFGLRPTSAFSSIVDLLTHAVFGKSEDSVLYYETRVNKPHPKVTGGASGFLQSLNPLPPADLEGGRTLFTRYGEPGYPKKGQFGIKKPKRAHELYARGFKDRENGSGFNAIDFINIRGYDDTAPDEYGDVKDLIKFYIRDIRNGKILRFRAFISGITDAISPQYNPYKFVGRPDEVYTYKGTTRAVSFTLKVAAMSRHEMYPMWEKLNYLVGLTYGSYADTSTAGQYAQTNPGMSAPITMLTLGDYFVDQPGYIKDLSITMENSPWDTIIDDEGKNAVGELPQQVDLNIGYQLIPQQIPDSYGKHFGKVGTPDVRGKDGLPWLPDMYMNDGISAVERFEGLGSGNPPPPATDDPTTEGEDPTETSAEDANNAGGDAANQAANDLPAGTPG